MKTPATATSRRLTRNDPNWEALLREIQLGAFVHEGYFVAFPMCFPGVTLPIPRDESRIIALTTDADGMVYGATTGRAHHVFFARFPGTSGIVLDLKWPDPAARCPALCCGPKHVLFAANPAAGGGRLLRRARQGRPTDLLHEWSFAKHPFEPVEDATYSAPILDLAATADRRFAVGATRDEVFVYDFAAECVVERRSTASAGRLCALGDGTVLGFDGTGALWRCRPAERALDAAVVKLPSSFGDPAAAHWAADRAGRFVYVISGSGTLFRLENGALAEKARFTVTPVTTAAATQDGRLFAFAGEGIAHFHIYDPRANSLRELGAAVSVFERRRYGYAFAAAAPGVSGEIFFGEDDDLGHLWLYFPAILPPAENGSR